MCVCVQWGVSVSPSETDGTLEPALAGSFSLGEKLHKRFPLSQYGVISRHGTRPGIEGPICKIKLYIRVRRGVRGS